MRANLHFKKKRKKVQAWNEFVEHSPKILAREEKATTTTTNFELQAVIKSVHRRILNSCSENSITRPASRYTSVQSSGETGIINDDPTCQVSSEEAGKTKEDRASRVSSNETGTTSNGDHTCHMSSEEEEVLTRLTNRGPIRVRKNKRKKSNQNPPQKKKNNDPVCHGCVIGKDGKDNKKITKKNPVFM